MRAARTETMSPLSRVKGTHGLASSETAGPALLKGDAAPAYRAFIIY
jgi:hypothetical protein